MSDPILQVTTSTSQVWDDPSEDLLYMLFEDIAAGDEEFFIVAQLSDKSGQTFCQVVFCGKSDRSIRCNCHRVHDAPLWTVERREGSAEEHYATGLSEMRAAHAVVSAWTHGHSPEVIENAAWQRLSFG